MRTGKLILTLLMFSSLSCWAESTATPSPPDASAPQPPPTGPCRDTATLPLDGTTVTCHPEAEVSVEFSPETGRTVVICTCRRHEPCSCEAFLDWQDPEPPSGGPSSRSGR